MSTHETHTLERGGGVALAVYRWLPDGPPRGLVHIVHGMAEHALRYGRFADALTAAGWAVVAHDQRGHGATTSDADLGHFADREGWRLVVEDVRAVRAWARESAPEGPHCLFGHSMGSFIALSLAIEDPRGIDLLVLSGTNKGGGLLVGAARWVARAERLRQGGRGKSALLAQLSFGDYNKAFAPNRTEFDWLSRDEAEVDAYVDDPRCGFRVTNQLWIDLLDVFAGLGSKARLQELPPGLPIYLFAGTQDPVGANGAGVRALADALRSAGLRDVELRLYAEARHECLNETHRDEVVGDIVEWLGRERS